MSILFASLAMVGGLLAFSAPATFAALPSGCSWGDVYYNINSVSKPIAITNWKKISLAPHTSYSKSTTLSLALTFSVKVTGSVSGTAEANAVLASVRATVGLSVELMGSFTGTVGFTDTFSASNPTSTQKHFIFYKGVREVTGGWTKWQCNRFEAWFNTGVSGGYYTFWDEPEGTVMCEATTGLDSMDKLAKSKYC